MPHLTIEHSANLSDQVDFTGLCEKLQSVLASFPAFPLGGIRVRSRPCPHWAVADLDPRNAFADLVLRIGAGRDLTLKKSAGEAVFAAARDWFAPQLAEPHFGLTFEIREVDPALSWKANSMHARLAKA